MVRWVDFLKQMIQNYQEIVRYYRVVTSAVSNAPSHTSLPPVRKWLKCINCNFRRHWLTIDVDCWDIYVWVSYNYIHRFMRSHKRWKIVLIHTTVIHTSTCLISLISSVYIFISLSRYILSLSFHNTRLQSMRFIGLCPWT